MKCRETSNSAPSGKSLAGWRPSSVSQGLGRGTRKLWTGAQLHSRVSGGTASWEKCRHGPHCPQGDWTTWSDTQLALKLLHGAPDPKNMSYVSYVYVKTKTFLFSHCLFSLFSALHKEIWGCQLASVWMWASTGSPSPIPSPLIIGIGCKLDWELYWQVCPFFPVSTFSRSLDAIKKTKASVWKG